MLTNLTIDNRLLSEARRVGGHKTMEAAATEALQEYIRHRKQSRIVELFGTIELDLKHDYKKQRRREPLK